MKTTFPVGLIITGFVSSSVTPFVCSVVSLLTFSFSGELFLFLLASLCCSFVDGVVDVSVDGVVIVIDADIDDEVNDEVNDEVDDEASEVEVEIKKDLTTLSSSENKEEKSQLEELNSTSSSTPSSSTTTTSTSTTTSTTPYQIPPTNSIPVNEENNPFVTNLQTTTRTITPLKPTHNLNEMYSQVLTTNPNH